MRGTGNKYVYADNNPLSKVDLYGLFPSNEGVDYTGDDGISSDPSSEPLYQESHPSVALQTGGQTGQNQSGPKANSCETAFCIKVGVWAKGWDDAARTYWQHFLDNTSPEAFGRMGQRYAQLHLKWDRFWASHDCGGANGPCGLAPSLAQMGVYTPPTKRVGRWMSREELTKMQATGRVQEGQLRGVTSVVDPANPQAYRNAPTGDVYVEFDVPASSVYPGGEGVGKIYGPSSVPYGEYYGITEMPEVTNIEIPEILLP
jgi:hypothetical protein